MPSIQLYLYDVRVQGEGSAKEIAQGIQFLNKFEPHPGKKLDVLIVGRGGGSLEDLWSFNEEEVVRAIFASSIPVISSVGHETDHCLSDLVADVRAPTPTAAAEMVSMVKTELLDIVDKLHARLQNFDRWLMPLSQKIDALDLRLSNSVQNILHRAKVIVDSASTKVLLLHPKEQIRIARQKIDNLNNRLMLSTNNRITQLKTQIENLAWVLSNLDPKSVLNRGFAIIKRENKVITKAALLSSGQSFTVILKDGNIEGTVNGKK
jgi:exodeoxyribonuclease VII large subunit